MSKAEHRHTCFSKLCRNSLGSDVCVNMEISGDNSLLSTESEKTNDHKENNDTDYATIISHPEVQLLKPLERSPASEKPSSPSLEVFNEDDKSLSSLRCVMGGAKSNQECSDHPTNNMPEVQNSCTLEILPEVKTKCPPQPFPKPARKPPKKPPRLNNPKKAERQGHSEEQVKGEDKRQSSEETSGTESNMDVGKPLQRVLWTDKKKVEWENGQDRWTGNYVNTTPPQPPDEKHDVAATRNYAFTNLTKAELTVSAPCPPVPPIKPPHLFSALIAALEKEKQEDEVLRNKTLLDKDSDLPMLNQLFVAKCSANQEVHLLRQSQRLCLMPPCRNSLNAAENHTYNEASLSGTQPQRKANQQLDTSSVSQHDTEVLRMNQDACQIGPKRLENKQEIDETVLGREIRQTNQNSSTRIKLKNFAMNVICKLKEVREEKRRAKARDLEMNGEQGHDTKVILDYDTVAPENNLLHDGTDWTEGGMEEEQDEEKMNEYDVVQSAVTETKEGVTERSASESSVNRVAKPSSGVAWSRFPCTEQSSTPDPPPDHTHSEGATHPFQLNLEAELDLSPDNTAVPEEEPIYEDIDLAKIIKEEQQTARSQMSLEMTDMYDTVEHANTYVNLSDIKCEAVLDNSVQTYLIKLHKKRKHKQRRGKGHSLTAGTHSQPSPQHVFTTSVFYNIPAVGGGEEQQSSAVKSGGQSPRSVAKVKVEEKNKTIPTAANRRTSHPF